MGTQPHLGGGKVLHGAYFVLREHPFTQHELMPLNTFRDERGS